jgi:hypothetical protein
MGKKKGLEVGLYIFTSVWQLHGKPNTAGNGGTQVG